MRLLEVRRCDIHFDPVKVRACVPPCQVQGKVGKCCTATPINNLELTNILFGMVLILGEEFSPKDLPSLPSQLVANLTVEQPLHCFGCR